MSAHYIPTNKTHGMANSPEYQAWNSAKQRCTNPNDGSYSRYGGRGIRMCDEWVNSFEAFYNYIGPRPSSNHSLDRYPNNDGNYEPGNCRWATKSEQAKNRPKPQSTVIIRVGCFYGSPLEW